MTHYQTRKAKVIAAFLTALPCSLTRHELAKCVSVMSDEQWRTVALTAGVPVADLPAKQAVLRLLRSRAVHVV